MCFVPLSCVPRNRLPHCPSVLVLLIDNCPIPCRPIKISLDAPVGVELDDQPISRPEPNRQLAWKSAKSAPPEVNLNPAPPSVSSNSVSRAVIFTSAPEEASAKMLSLTLLEDREG